MQFKTLYNHDEVTKDQAQHGMAHQHDFFFENSTLRVSNITKTCLLGSEKEMKAHAKL